MTISTLFWDLGLSLSINVPTNFFFEFSSSPSHVLINSNYILTKLMYIWYMGGDSGLLSMEEMAQQFNGGYGEVGHPHKLTETLT